MKRIIALIALAVFLSCSPPATLWAGGDKVQHENGNEVGPGSDAQGNQVGGD